MMGGELLLSAAALLSAIGAIVVAVWKRPVDKATEEQIKSTVSQMAAKNNRWRDLRLVHLEKYVTLDMEWHRKVVSLLHQAQDAGFIPASATIPAAPEIPEPPPYDP